MYFLIEFISFEHTRVYYEYKYIIFGDLKQKYLLKIIIKAEHIKG